MTDVKRNVYWGVNETYIIQRYMDYSEYFIFRTEMLSSIVGVDPSESAYTYKNKVHEWLETNDPNEISTEDGGDYRKYEMVSKGRVVTMTPWELIFLERLDGKVEWSFTVPVQLASEYTGVESLTDRRGHAEAALRSWDEKIIPMVTDAIGGRGNTASCPQK